MKASPRATLVAVVAVCTFFGRPAEAALSDADRWIKLPESIYVTGASSRDQDGDGLKDDLEHRLADTWRPYFVFDEGENNGANTSQLSLQSWEPRVLFQVRPEGCTTCAGARRLRVNWAFLFRMDGGYRGSNWCTNHHSGDSQRGVYELVSFDGGVNWALDRIDMWGFGWAWANAPGLSFSAKYNNIGGTGYARPLPMVWMSAGKHHQYYSGDACENADGFCDDDCGGGAQRIANLTPWGYFTNVGEPTLHPLWSGYINQPFVNDLWHIGYPNEYTWWAAWMRSDCGDIFTGGMNPGPDNTGAYQAGGGDTCTSPVYQLFD
ncbi:hypothetical protein [Hyalangium versicolor]|uniref:hypothetical protein n=1 Tax=Hyalangium versicolor TaxID=2861190 RepID=UPI001CCE318F|nr:hypothetical protein [Hyalangium versicolor]